MFEKDLLGFYTDLDANSRYLSLSAQTPSYYYLHQNFRLYTYELVLTYWLIVTVDLNL